jgi:putative ABC transport system substrate-binding protein
VELSPDVIFAGPSSVVLAVQRETRSIPIVFVRVADPVEQGIVDNLARPNGNATGFSNPDFSLLGKQLQILKDIVPSVIRVGLMIRSRIAAAAAPGVNPLMIEDETARSLRAHVRVLSRAVSGLQESSADELIDALIRAVRVGAVKHDEKGRVGAFAPV